MQQAQKRHYYTPEEYLALEAEADYRSEYHDGEIFPMSGGTTNHNQIAVNFATELNFALKQQDYRVFMADLRLWIPAHELYTYPDVFVIAGQAAYKEGCKDTVTNSLLIAEVLSKSTEAYDRGKKFTMYRSIAGFKEYLLINQGSYHVEQFSRTPENRWLLRDYSNQDDVISLTSLSARITLMDLYAKTDDL